MPPQWRGDSEQGTHCYYVLWCNDYGLNIDIRNIWQFNSNVFHNSNVANQQYNIRDTSTVISFIATTTTSQTNATLENVTTTSEQRLLSVSIADKRILYRRNTNSHKHNMNIITTTCTRNITTTTCKGNIITTTCKVNIIIATCKGNILTTTCKVKIMTTTCKGNIITTSYSDTH